MKLKFISIVLLAIGAVSIASGQEQLVPKSPFVLNVDYARFRLDDNSGYLEVYYGFYPRLITYGFAAGKYQGGVKLSMKLFNAMTKDVVREERSFLPLSLEDTSGASNRSTMTSQAGYALPFGDYVLSVAAQDSLTLSRRDSIALSIEIRPYGSNLTVSDIELCSSVKTSTEKSHPFYKNSLEVVPDAALVFGVMTHPVVFSYAEIYHLDPQQTYSVQSQIVDAGGKVVKESRKQHKYGMTDAVEVGSMTVTSLASGKYHFRYTISGEGERILARTDKTFYLSNPHVQVASPTAPILKSNELAGLSAEELEDEFRKAQYLATDQEIKTFSQIKTAEGRSEFLSKFWAEVQAGRLGKLPIPRVEYLQRAGRANQRYRVSGRDGWRTDRGRVYLLYGEPDEIERFPSSENSKPYEIWHFYSIESGVEFVFIDRSGFGDFILVHSTKRDELHDEDWARFLR